MRQQRIHADLVKSFRERIQNAPVWASRKVYSNRIVSANVHKPLAACSRSTNMSHSCVCDRCPDNTHASMRVHTRTHTVQILSLNHIILNKLLIGVAAQRLQHCAVNTVHNVTDFSPNKQWCCTLVTSTDSPGWMQLWIMHSKQVILLAVYHLELSHSFSFFECLPLLQFHILYSSCVLCFTKKFKF